MNENCTVQDVFNRFYPDYEKNMGNGRNSHFPVRNSSGDF